MMEAQEKCKGDSGLWCRARLCGALFSGGLWHAGAGAKQGSVAGGMAQVAMASSGRSAARVWHRLVRAAVVQGKLLGHGGGSCSEEGAVIENGGGGGCAFL